jgi:hypothetical protein
MTLSSAGALAQQANYASAQAVAGQKLQLRVHASAKRTCEPASPPTVRVTEFPKSGTITVQRASLTTDQIPNCPGLRTPAQVVSYVANAGYAGPDILSYEVTSSNGEVSTFVFKIDVKEGPKSPPSPTGKGI